MKRLLIFFLMCGSFMFSQSEYAFDYALLYKNTSFSGDANYSNIYFVNSKNNNYLLNTIKDTDSIHINLFFFDYRGKGSFSKTSTADFVKATTIYNECRSVFKFTNSYKHKVNEYEIEKHEDTLINDVFYYHYAIKSIKNIKYQKRNKIQSLHLIIDKNSKEFRPLLFQPLLYNQFVKTPILPNGLFKIIYYTNYKGTIISKEELIEAVKINRYLVIPEECDYAKTPK